MLPYADEIIVLDQGKVTAIGSYEEIIKGKPEIASKLQTSVEDSHLESPISGVPPVLSEKAHPGHIQPTDNQEDDHTRQQGSWSVYGYYFQSAGYTLLLCFLASATIECFCTSFQSWLTSRLFVLDSKANPLF
jgi:hypothetical protein